MLAVRIVIIMHLQGWLGLLCPVAAGSGSASGEAVPAGITDISSAAVASTFLAYSVGDADVDRLQPRMQKLSQKHRHNTC